MDVAIRLKCCTNPADASVHHVRWCYHVGAGFGMRHGLAHEHCDSFIIEHISRVIDDAVLTVSRVWVKSDIGNDNKVQKLGLDGLHRRLDEAVRISAFGTIEALPVGADNRKQRNCRYAEAYRLGKFFEKNIDAFALDAGHGRHRLHATFALQYKHRVDKVAGPEAGFGDETTQCRRPAATSQASVGELTGAGCTHSLTI